MHWDFNPAHPTIWVFGALVLVIAFAVKKGVPGMITGALDKRADGIQQNLDEASKLREEAQALLVEYQRKHAEADEQAKQIVEQAKRDADIMAQQARKDLTERIARRAVIAEAKIASAEAQAIADVKARAVELAAQASENLLKSDLSAADQNKLIKDGISDLGKALN